MERARFGLTILMLFGAVASPLGWADIGHHRGHHHGAVGIHFGIPWRGDYYGYPPYLYPVYSPLVLSPALPQVYIEKEPEAAPPVTDYWYFCPSPQGYYPYVRECPAGWQKRASQPQASP